MRVALLCVILFVACAVLPGAACGSDADCSLNGVCAGGVCSCDAPWSGVACAALAFAVTPAGARNIYNTSDPRNTWGGPVAGPGPDGKYHAYIPLYEAGSLWHVETTLHGVADAPTGPWDFASRPNISSQRINPSFLAYPDGSGGRVYSLWTQGGLHTAGSLDGPFLPASGGNSGVNPAPVFLNGAFYLTTQATREVVTAPAVTGPWAFFGNISHPATQDSTSEDPFLWIDKRGNWHILNHAYNTSEDANCGESHVSTHFFSADGKNWSYSDQPYGHTVSYDDGTQHTFATLERPNLLFNAAGQPAFLTVAVDLEADEQCKVKECCACCKFHDHAGTAVIALAV